MIPVYKGKNYEQESFKTLILGESTYTPTGKWGDDLPPDRNRAIIEDYVFKRDPGRTMERAVGVFYGRRPTYEEQCEFWNKTSFANFIQCDMGIPPGRPSDSHWKSGQKPFLEYLDDCKPQFVLVLGKTVWDSLPPAVQEAELVRGSDPRPCRIYRHKEGDAFVFGIDHPTSRRGWSYGKWHPWLERALDKART